MDKILKELKVEDMRDRNAVAGVRNKPYYAQLVSGIWEKNIASMPICKLLRMINTAAYIGVDSRKMVDQLLYRIGLNRDVFSQYFIAREGMYEPIAGKFGVAVVAEIRGILGPAPYMPGFVYSPDSNMMDAVRASNIRLALELQSGGAKITSSMFEAAIQFSSMEMFKWLLNYDVSPGKYLTPIINRGRLDLLPLIDLGEDDLYIRCNGDDMKGHYECLKYAMEHGCAISYFALDAAIVRDHPKCVSILLDSKINFRTEAAEHHVSCCKNADIWRTWIEKIGMRLHLKNRTVEANNTIGLSEIIRAGHVFDFRTHIRNYMPMSETMQKFWSSNFHKWKIVRIEHDGKAETLAGEVLCGSFRSEINSLRYQFGSPQQNEFICELLRTRHVEYEGVRFRVIFDPILVPYSDSNIEQIAWETIELLIWEKIDAAKLTA